MGRHMGGTKAAQSARRKTNFSAACQAALTQEKGDFRTFLGTDLPRITVTEAHMALHGYGAQRENAMLRQIVKMAHADLWQRADRYVAIITATLGGSDVA